VVEVNRLKEILSYNKDSGVFTWLKKPSAKSSRVKIGEVAGYVQDYVKIKIDGKQYKAHRLAWLYMTGYFPKEQIDHINHIKTDNRFVNLREVNNQENHKNRTVNKNNTSGVVGVGWHKASKKWLAKIGIEGTEVQLGTFVLFSDAVNARKNAEVLYGFHKNHGKG